jgi:hypothetical protein
MSGDQPALRDLQTWMRDALLYPLQVSRAEADRTLLASPGLSAADGLAIYQRGFFLRIAHCMREQFPALCHALGEALFNDFVAEYIRDKPPESYTLHDLGRRFPGWLDETRPDRDAAPEQREIWADFIIDLAQYERQVFVMFDAEGHEGKPFADADTPDRLLRLQPCFALGAYRFPVAVYYHDVRLSRSPTPPARAPSFVALARTDYLTHTIPLREPHHVFLSALRDGGGVDDGIAAVAAHLAIPTEEARRSWRAPEGIRRRWLAAGFFIASDGVGDAGRDDARTTGRAP